METRKQGDKEQEESRADGTVLNFVMPAFFAVFVYWSALQLPLVYDTILHTQFADDLDWVSVWQPSERFGFYRPLVFAPMILIRQMFGGYPAVLLHALSIGQHALNVLLLTTLTWRLWRNHRFSLMSGVLFATYPFTYQAVIVYGNNGYLTATGFILLGLHAYISGEMLEVKSEKRWLRPLQRYSLPFTILFFILGILTHETTILLIPLCLLIALIHNSQFTIHNSQFFRLIFHPTTLILSLVASIYLTIYALLPRGSGPLLDYGGNELWPKLLILMQSAGYPITFWGWYSQWLPEIATIVTGSVVVLGMSMIVAWQRPAWRRPLMFGWAWWLGGSLLIAVTLPTYYIADGARLLYFGGVGIGLVWGGVLTAVSYLFDNRALWLRLPIVIILLMLILIPNTSFIWSLIAQYERASEPIETIAAVLDTRPTAAEGVAVVNFTQWVSPEQTTFPAGNEWSPVMGDHLFLAELFKANEGREFKFVSLTEPALLSNETTYNYGIIGARTVPVVPLNPEVERFHLFISRYGETAIQTDYTGQIVQDGGLADGTPLAQFSTYTLLEATAEQCGSTVNSSLTLTLEAPPPATVALFVQLLGTDGRLLAQADGPPLGLPPDRIETTAETLLIDHRQLTTTEGDPAQLIIGLYDYTTGERFPATDGEGQLLADNALRIPLTSCRQPSR